MSGTAENMVLVLCVVFFIGIAIERRQQAPLPKKQIGFTKPNGALR